METDKIIDLIGKRMCHVETIYPNDGKWTLYTRFDNKSFRAETINEVFYEFYKYLNEKGITPEKIPCDYCGRNDIRLEKDYYNCSQCNWKMCLRCASSDCENNIVCPICKENK